MDLPKGTSFLKLENIEYLNKVLYKKNGYLRILPKKEYDKIKFDHLRLLAHMNGIYSFPTLELYNWIKDHFDLSNCIEIGAGNGSLAYHLKIPATDAKLTDKKEVQQYYIMLGQPIVKYGQNIKKLNAVQAIKKYKPDTVIAQWVTHIYNRKEAFREGNMYGVDEQYILDNVKNYIFIGNTSTHKLKPILQIQHKSFKYNWLVSRSMNQENNIIYIWG